ncbi:MAG: tetratricopeptide repeat protein [Candidatus Omnitrophica bacterium]|nr:tetratricopeptide repeat protein [Candidatus Omnitrophota bacterium]
MGLVFLAICAACFLAYANSLTNPFIWDDEALVVNNPLIRSWSNFGASFTNELYLGTNSSSNFYRPLQTISYIFDYHFWRLNPLGYHLSNIILQAAVSCLVFLLVFHLLASLPIAAATAVFFAASPLNTEAVTYISGRAEMLMGFFAILSLLLFIRSQKSGAIRPILFYILSLISFILALLSKEAAIVFPFIICGYIFYLLPERLKERYYFIKRAAPFFAVSLIYLISRFLLLESSVSLAPALHSRASWFVRLSCLPQIIITYLKLLILPVNLHMSRQLAWGESYAGCPLGLIYLGLIVVACAYYLRHSAKNKFAPFMFFWALVFFIPQSGIFPINTFIAEHFIYLSSISFFAFLAYILHKVLRRRLFVLAICGLSGFYILLSAGRNFEWANPVVFYRNIIKYSPGSFQAHNNLGLQYELKGLHAQAIEEYKLALEIKPGLIEARANLANLYFKLRRFSEARKEYEFVEKVCPPEKAGEVENNIANIYEAEGRVEQAIQKYKLALKLDPRIKFAHFNLARIYYGRGEHDLAGLHILESLSEITATAKAADCEVISGFLRNSAYVDSAEQFYNNLGINFARQGRWEAAVSAFNRCLELNPWFSDYYYNLGLAYLNMGQRLKAKRALSQAISIDPNHIRAKKLINDKSKKPLMPIKVLLK